MKEARAGLLNNRGPRIVWQNAESLPASADSGILRANRALRM